jgi:hypothetical protein
MDQRELVIRRFQQILPNPAADYIELPREELQIWIREDLTPLLEDYIRRPTVQDYAAWPMRALAIGSVSPERRLIEGVDEALVACGNALARLGANKMLAAKAAKLFPNKESITGGTIEFGDHGSERTSVQVGVVPVGQIELNQIAGIGERDWADLVNLDDYLEPATEWIVNPDGTHIQRGDTIVAFNRNLHLVGNFIVRRMLARVEWRFKLIEKQRQHYLDALNAVVPSYTSQFSTLELAWTRLNKLNNDLQQTFHPAHKLNKLRDACIILVQLYAAFSPDGDLSWLGLSQQTIANSGGAIRIRGNGYRGPHFFERIADALVTLDQLYEENDPSIDEIESAIATGILVVDRGRGLAFWNAEKLNISSKGAQWKLLVKLAEKVRTKSQVGLNDVWGDRAVSDSIISSTCERLRRNLSPSLRGKVLPGDLTKTYRLDLEPNQVRIFDTRPRN